VEYQNFSVEEFALDPYFKQWVLFPAQDSELFWIKWLLQHPDKKDTVEQARSIVMFLGFKDDLHAYEIDEEWDKVYAKITSTSSSGFLYADESEAKPVWWQQDYSNVAAALVALLFAIGVYLAVSYAHKPEYISYTTPYSETMEVELPDGSTATLNAASKITYSTQWGDRDTREVWIDGEAFFSVKHTKNHQKFIVHTDKKSSVEVLGTKFNVYDRHKRIQVVLQEGKVQVTAKEKSSPFVLAPGELVEWHEGEENLQKQKVNTHLYTSWKENEILFEKTPLKRVAQTLEDINGVEVIFKNPSLRALNFTGSLSTKDMDSFLLSLSKSFKIQVMREGNQITLGK